MLMLEPASILTLESFRRLPPIVHKGNPGSFLVGMTSLPPQVDSLSFHLVQKVPVRSPGSPWENGYCESFNGKLRDECLNGEIFYSLKEAQVLIEQWRVQYNTVRPHSALGYRPPAPGAYSPPLPLKPVSQPQAAM